MNVSVDFFSQNLNDMPIILTTMRLSSSVAGAKQKVTRHTVTSPALTISKPLPYLYEASHLLIKCSHVKFIDKFSSCELCHKTYISVRH